MNEIEIKEIILKHYPDVQAIYIFGSFGTDYERDDSDVDIALLLPHEKADRIKSFLFTECLGELIGILKKDVDLINLRKVSTVFQKEIIANSRVVYCSDKFALNEFEMLVLSYYQELNDERRGIIKEIAQSERIVGI